VVELGHILGLNRSSSHDTSAVVTETVVVLGAGDNVGELESSTATDDGDVLFCSPAAS